MPGSVRAAQITIFVIAGIGLLVTVFQGVTIDSYYAGRDTAMYGLYWILAIVACFFGVGGNGIRITATVLVALEAFCGLGAFASAGRPQPLTTSGQYYAPGILAGPLILVAAIAIIVLLYQGSAGRWFKRPRAGR
ncbi:hypothetical protein [Nocardia sp. NPDC052566]|uniref:hypothetical protein n=1 Tax=Nocardia sp. NPDC052566 TaxID=3364330 RepID=UPI0037C9FCBB